MTYHILYVEDDPDIREVASIALEIMGEFTVTACSSGYEAVAIAATLHPNVIILDAMMPKMDGTATYHALQKIPHLMNIPVIFMTAKAQHHEKNTYLQLGAIGVITKPFNPITLSNAVKSLLLS